MSFTQKIKNLKAVDTMICHSIFNHSEKKVLGIMCIFVCVERTQPQKIITSRRHHHLQPHDEEVLHYEELSFIM